MWTLRCMYFIRGLLLTERYPGANAVNLKRYHQKRDAWLQENGPCIRCGSWDDLQIDHIDPATKDRSLARTNLWNISKKRREVELAKCQVLCKACHQKKSGMERHKEFCVRNHAMTPENIQIVRGGSWACRACQKDYNQRRRESRRANA